MFLLTLGGLLILVAGAVSVEMYCRWKWRGIALREDLYADPRWRKPFPFIMFKGRPHYQHLNELGYPGAAPQMPKPVGEYRVVILGGSTVFNGAPTIAEIIEQRCHDHGLDRVRVYNGGVVSSSSGMELARTLFDFCDRGPDLIVFYNGGNDLIGPHFSDPRPGYPPNFVVHEANPILQEDVRKYPTLALVLYGSILLRYRAAQYFHAKFVPLREAQAAAQHRTPQWEQALVQRYVENLIRASKVARGFDARFVAFFQPSLLFKDPECVTEEERPYEAAPDNTYWLRLRAMTLEALGAASEASGLLAIDLSGMFSSSPQWMFKDALHVHQTTRDLIGARIFEELNRRGLLCRSVGGESSSAG